MAKTRKNDFRQAFLEAMRKERDTGKLKPGQYVLLWLASTNPKFVTKAEELVAHETSGGLSGFDIDKLIEAIRKLMPLILELVNMFKVLFP